MIYYSKEIEGEEEGSKEKVITFAYGESLKAWFIKTIIYYNGEEQHKIEDVIVVKYASPQIKTTAGFYGELLYKKNGLYYVCYGNDITSEHIIDEQEYWKRAADIFKNSLPDVKALSEATGGGQDKSTIQEAIPRFFPFYASAVAHTVSDQLANMRSEVAADTSETFRFAREFIEFTLIPFIQIYHNDFTKDHASELIVLLKKIIDDSLGKEAPPTYKQLIMFIIDPVASEFKQYSSEVMSRTMQNELGDLRQYIYANHIEKADAELTTSDKRQTVQLSNIVKGVIIDDELNEKNQTKISLMLQKIANDMISHDRNNTYPKQFARNRINYFFKELNAKIDTIKNEQTKKELKLIAVKAQSDAYKILEDYQ